LWWGLPLLLAFFCGSLLSAAGPEDVGKNEGWNVLKKIVGPGATVYPFGIKDPEGNRAILPVSSTTAAKMKNILTYYPYEVKGNLVYWDVSSWKDASKAVLTSVEGSTALYYDLRQEIAALKKRVMALEQTLEAIKKKPPAP
jgi:hypothetical protein